MTDQVSAPAATNWSSLFNAAAPASVQTNVAQPPSFDPTSAKAGFNQIGLFGALNAINQSHALSQAHVAKTLGDGTPLTTSQLFESMRPSPLGNHETNIVNIGMPYDAAPAPPATTPAAVPPVVPPVEPIVAAPPWTAQPVPVTQPLAPPPVTQPGLGLPQNSLRNKLLTIAGAAAAGAGLVAGGAALRSPDPLPVQIIEGTARWEIDQDVERESGSVSQQSQESNGL